MVLIIVHHLTLIIARIFFLVLDEGPSSDINDSFGSPEKMFRINFTKTNAKFCLILHYNHEHSYLFVYGKEIYNFKVDDKNVNFPTQFCVWGISNEFGVIVSRETFLEGNMYDFSVYCNAISKSDILSIHKYLVNKNNIK